MGKAGFQELKAKIFHKLTPPVDVSPLRYRIGLVMFGLPLLQGLLETWASHIASQLVANRLLVDIVMDVMLIGGNFWCASSSTLIWISANDLRVTYR